MRVLLAGATGALGRELLPHLVAAGHSVTGITRVAGSVASSGAHEIVADVLHRDRLLAATDGLGFDAVLHLATALRRPPRRYEHMRPTNALRIEGTSNLLAVARATGATRFVAASSVYGYGFGDFGRYELHETDSFGEEPGGRADPVFRALISAEQQARAFGGVALRFGICYRSRGDVSPVSSSWRGELPFLHIADAATATLAALDGERGAAYNIVDDTPASWREVNEERARVLGRRAPRTIPSWLLRRVAPFGAELLTGTSMRVSNARARADLGWAPTFASYREGIAAGATTTALSPTSAARQPGGVTAQE
jgi:nucleoside-diphosphate-sugar epimerase